MGESANEFDEQLASQAARPATSPFAALLKLRRPLYALLFGGVLMLIDYSYGSTTNGYGWSWDWLPDIFGSLLIVWGLIRVARNPAASMVSARMWVFALLALICLVEAAMVLRVTPGKPSFGVGIARIVLLLACVIAPLFFALGMRRVSREHSLMRAVEAWTFTAWAFGLIYVALVGSFMALALVAAAWPFALSVKMDGEAALFTVWAIMLVPYLFMWRAISLTMSEARIADLERHGTRMAAGKPYIGLRPWATMSGIIIAAALVVAVTITGVRAAQEHERLEEQKACVSVLSKILYYGGSAVYGTEGVAESLDGPYGEVMRRAVAAGDWSGEMLVTGWWEPTTPQELDILKDEIQAKESWMSFCQRARAAQSRLGPAYSKLGHYSVRALDFSADGEWLLSVTDKVELFSMREELNHGYAMQYVPHRGSDTGYRNLPLGENGKSFALGGCFSRDGTRVMAWDRSTLKVWETATGRELVAVAAKTNAWFTKAVMLPDGKRALAVTYAQGATETLDPPSGRLRLLDLTSGADLPLPESLLADGADRQWDRRGIVSVRRPVFVLPHPDNRSVIVLMESSKAAQRIDLSTGAVIREYPLTEHTRDTWNATTAALSPDGGRLAVYSAGDFSGLRCGTFGCMDTESGAVLWIQHEREIVEHPVFAHGSSVRFIEGTSLLFSPDGSTIFAPCRQPVLHADDDWLKVGEGDSWLEAIDAESGTTIKVMATQEEVLRRAYPGPSGGKRHDLKIGDCIYLERCGPYGGSIGPPSPRPQQTNGRVVTVTAPSPTALAISPDGKRLLAGTSGGALLSFPKRYQRHDD